VLCHKIAREGEPSENPHMLFILPHNSTLVALAEKRAKLVPLPFHFAPIGWGSPSVMPALLKSVMKPTEQQPTR
jgi:hypothetical protein